MISSLVFVGAATLAISAKAHAAANRGGEGGESTVTIPLDTYLSLIKPKEAQALTTVESATLSGEFGEKLRLRIVGTSVGRPSPQGVLRTSPQYMISKCAGSANIVNRDQMISILANSGKDGKFQVDCEISVKSWGELVFNFDDVLFIASNVGGADSSVEDNKIVLHRKLKELTGVAAEVTVTGRYQVSVLPETTKFTYNFDLHNPNRAKKSYVLTLPNGESVTRIETGAEYKELDNGKISFNLNPGANRVQVVGALGVTKWRAPVANALQYLMIQNSPMLQLKIDTTAKRISNEDSRMPASYSSSRTYLLDAKSLFSWDVKKLEVIASTGYSIGQALYNMYVPDEGPGIVEARFSIQNSGTPELALRIPGKPVYLEVDSQPQVLAKDTDGLLLTQVPNGHHEIVVQYKTEKPFSGWMTNINEMMVRPSTALSNVHVNVGFAKSWSAIFGSVLTDYFNRFPLIDVALALFAVLLWFGFFKKIDLKSQVKWGLLAGLFILHVLKPSLFYISFVALAALLMVHHRTDMQRRFAMQSRLRKALTVCGVLGLALFLYTFGGNPARSISNLAARDEAQMSIARMEMAVPPAAPPMPTAYRTKMGGTVKSGAGSGGLMGAFSQLQAAAPMAETASEESADIEMGATGTGAATEDFKGLPAKIQIPLADHSLAFSQGLVDDKANASVRLLVVNPKILTTIYLICILLCGFLIYRERRQFATYLRIG